MGILRINKIPFYIFFICFLTIAGTTAFGQTACFTVNNPRGCAPLTINVSDCSGENSTIVYYYDYVNAPGNFTSDTFHTFTNPGKYTVLQNVAVSGGSVTTTRQVEVLEKFTPEFDISICEDSTIYLYFSDIYEEYFVDYGDGQIDTVSYDSIASHKYSGASSFNLNVTGNYVPGNCGTDTSINIQLFSKMNKPVISSLNQITKDSLVIAFTGQPYVKYLISYSVNDTSNFIAVDSLIAKSVVNIIPLNMNMSQGQMCFQVKAYDNCGNSSFSDPVCLIIPDVTSKTGYNEVKWSRYAGNGFSNLKLFKDSVLYTSYISNSDVFIQDSNIYCGLEYCYYLKIELSSGTTITSTDTCITGYSDQIGDTLWLNSTYNNNNEVVVFWNTPATLADKYQILQNSELVDETTDSFLVINKGSGCYNGTIVDICNNISDPGNSTCPIILAASTDPDDPNFIFLEWNSYEGKDWINNDSRYFIELLDTANAVVDSLEISPAISYDMPVNYSYNLQNLRYRIKARLFNFETYSNIEEVKVINKVFVPTAFSPNGDGLNDVFEVKARFSTSSRIRIFDRWNNKLFESTGLDQGWDGKYQNGKEAPAGVYTYSVEVIDQNSDIFESVGTLTLIK